MVYKSRYHTVIHKETLPTCIFGSPQFPLSNTSNKPVLLDARDPDKYFLTVRSYRLWCQRFAAGLRANGLKKGDAVLLFSGNTIFFSVVLMGVIMAGGVFTGANPTYTPRELAYQIKDSGAKIVICADNSTKTALEAAHIAGIPTSRVFVFDDGFATFEGRGKGVGNLQHWTKLMASPEEGEKFQWDELSEQEVVDTVVTLNYSSGTTGVPKGVMITHYNYISNALQLEFQGRLDPEYEQNLPNYRFICFLPMYHAMAQIIFAVNAMKTQTPVYVMAKFDFVQMLENVQKFRISHLILVPPVVVAMAKSPLTKKYDLSSVIAAGSGAAPLGREICVEFEKLWPDGRINVKQGWGMTELTCAATGWRKEDYSDSFSIGELNANCEAMLVDDNNKEVAHGERGEIWIRAPNVMKGYWNRPDATAECLTKDGWLKTGDIAYADKHNRFYIVDRKKELIKVKGNQVAPAELEALLLNHDAIADSAVIGVTKDGEEYPRAYLVLQQGKNMTEKEVQEWLAKQVAPHKRLTGGVRFVDVIPKNPSGKILRKVLRDQAKAEMEGKSSRL